MKLLPVTAQDIPTVSKFASKVFTDYYTPINGGDSAEYMAEKFLSCKAIKQLITKGAIFKMLMDEKRIIGFTEYQIIDKRVFLSKLYLEENSRHKGLSKIMFNDVKQYCLENQLNKIYLTVNKHNIPSFNLYLHWGFKVIDSVVNDIGEGYVMDDYIMELSL